MSPQSFLFGGKWRDGAESLNNGFELGNDVFYLFFGIIAREAKADRAVDRCKRDTHGPQDIGWLQRPGGAG